MTPDRASLPRFIRQRFDGLVKAFRNEDRSQADPWVKTANAKRRAFEECLLRLGFDPKTGRPLK